MNLLKAVKRLTKTVRKVSSAIDDAKALHAAVGETMTEAHNAAGELLDLADQAKTSVVRLAEGAAKTVGKIGKKEPLRVKIHVVKP